MRSATVFTRAGCGPCRTVLREVVPRLEAAGLDVEVVDLHERPCYARAFGIRFIVVDPHDTPTGRFIEMARNCSVETIDFRSGLAIQPKFRNPSMPSVVSQADAMLKMVQVIPWLGDSDVALEELGFSDDQMLRLRSDRDRARVRAVVAAAAAPIALPPKAGAQ